jgi:hypothetical protein
MRQTGQSRRQDVLLSAAIALCTAHRPRGGLFDIARPGREAHPTTGAMVRTLMPATTGLSIAIRPWRQRARVSHLTRGHSGGRPRNSTIPKRAPSCLRRLENVPRIMRDPCTCNVRESPTGPFLRRVSNAPGQRAACWSLRSSFIRRHQSSRGRDSAAIGWD